MKQLLIFLIFPILGYCSTPEEIIQYVNSQNTHWTAGFPAKSRESMMKSVISDKDIVGFRENIPISNKFSSKFDLSPSFDAREQWPECSSIPLINDVSECKSNWAFAASEAMSDRLCINSGGMIDTVLSAQELLTCCVGTFSCGEGCSGGGNPFKAWQYWQKHGLPTGGSYVSNFGCKPYTIAPCGQTINNVTYPACTNTTVATPVCEKTCRDGYGVDLDKDRHFGASVDQLPNSQIEIQSDVMLNGPIEVTFEVFDDFFQYQTGIYVHLTGNKQGHLSVRVLGWGIWQGVPYWLLANSWGYSWGENGTFRVLRGLNECGIEANAISGMPKLG